VGATPRVQVSSQREANRSVAMAIALNRGAVFSKMRVGAFNTASFNDFLQGLCTELRRQGFYNPIFVMDNCPIHSRANLEVLREHGGVEYRFLPPWTPMLNPIEEVFAGLKRAIRTELTITHRDELRAIDLGPRGDKARRRGEILDRAFATALDGIHPNRVNTHITHTNTVIGQVVRMEDL